MPVKTALATAQVVARPQISHVDLIRAAQAEKMARTIRKLTPIIARDLRSRDPIVHSAAKQLQALVYAEPWRASMFIKNMRENLALTNELELGRKHGVLTKVYARMDGLWRLAQRG